MAIPVSVKGVRHYSIPPCEGQARQTRAGTWAKGHNYTHLQLAPQRLGLQRRRRHALAVARVEGGHLRSYTEVFVHSITEFVRTILMAW